MYRRDRNVPMAELRAFIDQLRDRYGIPYPLADRRSFVIDRQLVHEAQDARRAPEVRFGKPAIGGISTEVIWEHAAGGEDEHEIADAFDLDVSDIRWALAYEMPLRAA
jgi:uncharacterized protein (DUF433 family)